MKKRFIIGIIIFVVLSVVCYIITPKKDPNKTYFTNKYYNKGKFVEITHDKISSLDKDTYLLYTYNNYFAFQSLCDKEFEKFMRKYKIDMISMTFSEFKKTNYYKKVSYAPAVLIIKKGKIIAYLDANSDDDILKYQDSKEFAKWVGKYISLNKY